MQESPIEKAKRLVVWQHNVVGIGTPKQEQIEEISEEDVVVVWFCYILGGWKTLLFIPRMEGRYYEVTHKPEHDGSDGPAETYIDTYLKTHNIAVPD